MSLLHCDACVRARECARILASFPVQLYNQIVSVCCVADAKGRFEAVQRLRADEPCVSVLHSHDITIYHGICFL